MRAMRRKFSTACVVWILLVEGGPRLLAVQPPTADQQRALMVEYVTAMTDSAIASVQARTHRETNIRWDANNSQTRTELEIVCEVGYHMQVFRDDKLVTDFYRIDGTEYRRSNGNWVASPAANGRVYCEPSGKIPQRVAAMQEGRRRGLADLDEMATRERVTKGPIKAVHGVRCQEWMVKSLPALREPSPLQPHLQHSPGDEFFSECIGLKDHYPMERIMNGINSRPWTTTLYDWNKPIKIRAPR